MERVQAANYWAMRRYQPRVYSGRIVHFFSARDQGGPGPDRRLGWTRLALGGQEIIRVSGENSGRMLIRPHVSELAAHLREILDQSRTDRLSG